MPEPETVVGPGLMILGLAFIVLVLVSVAVPGLTIFAIDTGTLQETTEDPNATFGLAMYTFSGIFRPDGSVDFNFATPGSYISQSFVADNDYFITRADFAVERREAGPADFSYRAKLYNVNGTIGSNARPVYEQPLAVSEARTDIAEILHVPVWVSFNFPILQQYRLRAGNGYSIAIVQGDELAWSAYTIDVYGMRVYNENTHEGNAFHQHPPNAPEPVFGDIGMRVYGTETEPSTTTTTENQTTPAPSTTVHVQLFPLSEMQTVLLFSGIAFVVAGALFRRKNW